MYDLTNLLEYQTIDIELKKVLDLIDKSDDAKRMKQARNEFNIAKQTVIDSEKEAAGLVGYYQEVLQSFNNLTSKVEELTLTAENNEDDELISKYLGELNNLKQKLNEIEKKLLETKNKSEKLIRDYKEANERGRKMKDIHNASKDKLDTFKNSKEAEINNLKSKLDKLEPKIDKELMIKYKTLAGEGKYPAFVEAYEDGQTFSCRGCGLALSQKNKSELVEHGLCKCETCRRIIYRKNK